MLQQALSPSPRAAQTTSLTVEVRDGTANPAWDALAAERLNYAGYNTTLAPADRLNYAKAGVVLPSGPGLRLSFTLDHAQVRSLDDQKQYGCSGLGIAGDLPGFWWFTTLRVDLGVGLQSDIAGVKGVNGYVALLRVF